MDRMNFRITLLAAALIGATTLAALPLVQAQQGAYGPGYGMGPGMMGGYGPGPGAGYGYGHGMGPWMMGPGMMGGYGPGYGTGPGMMGGGHGMLYQLDLSADQWRKVNAIHEDFAKKQWELAGKMREEGHKLRNLMAAETRDQGAIAGEYRKLQELRLQSLQLRVGAQEKIGGLLTEEQNEQLRRFEPGCAFGVE